MQGKTLEQIELEQHNAARAMAAASARPTRAATAAPDEEDDSIRVVLSLPASAAGHDLAITLSPRKNQTPGRSSQHNSSNEDGPLPSWSLPAGGGATGEDPFTPANTAPPSSQSVATLRERHAVSDALKAQYPSNPYSDGWKHQKWYVIRRGLEIGIWYDYWGHIVPFVKNENYVDYQGVSYKSANTHAQARGIWRLALNGNQIRRLV